MPDDAIARFVVCVGMGGGGKGVGGGETDSKQCWPRLHPGEYPMRSRMQRDCAGGRVGAWRPCCVCNNEGEYRVVQGEGGAVLWCTSRP